MAAWLVVRGFSFSFEREREEMSEVDEGSKWGHFGNNRRLRYDE